MTALLLAAILLPLLTAALLPLRTTRNVAQALTPLAPLPALGLALFAAPGLTLDLPWMLLGTSLGLDATTRIFLFFTAALWVCAAIYAHAYLADDARRRRFTGFFLLTCAGNLGLILAQDIASFYLFFALMTFSAYGLVVHDGNAPARRAGRVYIVMAVLGEALLLSGFMLLAHTAGTQDIERAVRAVGHAAQGELIVVLLFVGFGVKAGALLLHLWLPLAHPVAPTPASAVLSGAIIKAGLLGWLRFLPLGAVALPEPGTVMIAAGLFAAFYGVLIGVTERDPKVILAYSSISQMGLMAVGVGAGLLLPQAWPLLLPALTLFALHHAFAKGSLFFGVGLAARAGRARPGVLLAQLLAAFALAGAPLTSGALVKVQLKDALALLPAPWPEWLAWLLPLAAVGTVVLMIRFLLVSASARTATGVVAPGLWWAWGLLAVLWISGFILLARSQPWVESANLLSHTIAATGRWAALWPVAAGSALVALLLLPPIRPIVARVAPIPPGDVLVWIESALAWLLATTASGRSTAGEPSEPVPGTRLIGAIGAIGRIEARLRTWGAAFAALLILLALLAALFAAG